MNRVIHQHNYCYMKLRICGTRSPSDDRNDIKALVEAALTSLHGQIGASLQVDVLQWLGHESLAVLRVPHSAVQKLWSALVMLGQFRGQPCAIEVLQVSSSLSSLAINHCVSPGGALLKIT